MTLFPSQGTPDGGAGRDARRPICPGRLTPPSRGARPHSQEAQMRIRVRPVLDRAAELACILVLVLASAVFCRALEFIATGR